MRRPQKFEEISLLVLTLLSNIETNFVAFSEYMNFSYIFFKNYKVASVELK